MTTTAVIPSSVGGVLVASPSTAFREQVRRRLPECRRPVREVRGGADALAELESGGWQTLFVDRKLPDLDAEELATIIGLRFPDTEVVLLDAETGVTTQGPTNGRAPIPARLESSVAEVVPLPGMVGQSGAMQSLYQKARAVAARDTTVLILGATGTGKELVARAVHALSRRSHRPYIVVNCAAIPEALLESELFGYVRGAFTGAVQNYMGKISAAQGGTLFLDEVGELPVGLQAKLLRFLEQKEVQRLGSCEAARVDVRVIAATNADLDEKFARKEFREDLYYRLSAFPLELPVLAERQGDILQLAEHFLRSLADPDGAIPSLTPSARRLLELHGWPGNVRELQQVVERALILAEGSGRIGAEHICFWPRLICDRKSLPTDAMAEARPC
jgi:transcriptional regulator with GAF, ATPase, and Fis domain